MLTNTPTTSLSCIEINPPTQAIGSVIWLHGLGADGNDFVPIVSDLDLPSSLPLRFIFPHAPLQPVTINNGYIMRAWYDIISMDVDQHADQQGINKSIGLLEELIEKEESFGIPTHKIILAGFSQGAVIALSATLRLTKRFAGILALSGYLPNADRLIKESSSINKMTPIFLAHGTEDTIVPYFLGEATSHILKKFHYPITWKSYAMAHSVCKSEIEDIAKWLITLFSEIR